MNVVVLRYNDLIPMYVKLSNHRAAHPNNLSSIRMYLLIVDFQKLESYNRLLSFALRRLI